MSKLEITRNVVIVGASLAVGMVVNRILVANTPIGRGAIEKAVVTVGCGLLASMVAREASGYAGDEFDEFVDMVKELQ